MSDRERLIELISKVQYLGGLEEKVADHLLANGVKPIVHCKDCIYFQPDFVLTQEGERRPYTQEEKESGFGYVTIEKGINCGSRCERHGYWEENKIPVWFSENDFCSYGELKEREG